MFDRISKHLKVRQKYSAVRAIFSSLLVVWKCGQTRSFVFDILRRALIWVFLFLQVMDLAMTTRPMFYQRGRRTSSMTY